MLRKIILLIPFIYILPNFFADKAFAVFLAEPVADLLAVTFTAILFFLQFRKALAKLSSLSLKNQIGRENSCFEIQRQAIPSAGTAPASPIKN